ncbi:MHC Class-I [Eptesicus fuscus gammaherpesvirus]|uniref:MHC Class-I n=1 Tax=vespertilionid gammaherpesvirus 3 TaxID=2846598 RepID=A0A2D0ZNW2_9GAMA|nr:MHC Class-I [Eptesicus fuscus gammaherpesvirus]ATA58239.1 MHC Class-I [Eptesicus fuscus gammaherpesvirus]
MGYAGEGTGARPPARGPQSGRRDLLALRTGHMHTMRWMFGCDVDANGEVERREDKFFLDGDEYLELSMDSETWLASCAEGRQLARKLMSANALEKHVHALGNLCPRWISWYRKRGSRATWRTGESSDCPRGGERQTSAGARGKESAGAGDGEGGDRANAERALTRPFASLSSVFRPRPSPSPPSVAPSPAANVFSAGERARHAGETDVPRRGLLPVSNLNPVEKLRCTCVRESGGGAAADGEWDFSDEQHPRRVRGPRADVRVRRNAREHVGREGAQAHGGGDSQARAQG